MVVYLSYLVLFVPTVFISFLLLRFFSLSFIYDNIPDYFTGSFGTSMIVVVVLLIACLIISYKITRPFDKAVKEIQEGKLDISNDEKYACLKTYQNLNLATIIVNLIGFFFGQIIVTATSVVTGKISFVPLMHTIVVMQAVGFGMMGAIVVINGLDSVFAKYRKMLKIQSFDDFNNLRITKISTSIIVTFCISLYFIAINLVSVIYGFNQTGFSESWIGKVILCCIVSAVVSLIAFSFIFNGLKERMVLTKESIDTIAVKGDLSQRIDITMLDDFGQVTSSINKMIVTLSDMIKELTNKTEQASFAADNITDTSFTASTALEQMDASLKKINDNSNNQNSLIKQADENIVNLTDSVETVKEHVRQQLKYAENISDSVSKMSDSITSVADIARKAQDTSNALTTSSQIGEESIRNAVETMNQIQEYSKEVIKIIKVIQAIASQTNLLSMNAAIEASHAGVYGQGFAVVADEVRSLAESSSKSAKNIQKHIKQMASKVNQGVEAINIAGKSFNDISHRVEENAAYVNSISQAMEEQSQGAKSTQQSAIEVFDSVNAVNTITDQESQAALRVKDFMSTVVSASDSTMTAVNESSIAVSNLRSSVQSVSDSAKDNKDAVATIHSHVKHFTV